MLQELDMQENFKEIAENAKIEDIPEDSKIGKLINMIVERNKEILHAGKHAESLYDSKNTSMKDQLNLLDGLKEITQYNFDEDGKL